MSYERREHERYGVNWRARVAYNGDLYDVQLKDVSKGGVGILFPVLLTIGTKMSVEFHVKYQGKQTRIRAKTTVAFNTMLSDNKGAKLGLQFAAMSKEDSQVLGNILNFLEQEAE